MPDPVDYVPFETTTAPGAVESASAELERLYDVPVELAVEIGRTHMTIRETLALGPGLDRHARPAGRRARRPAGQRQADRPRRGRRARRGVRPARHRGAGERPAGTAPEPPRRPLRRPTGAAPACRRPRLSRRRQRGIVPRVPRRARPAVVAFWRKGYEDNLTGMSGMVAYNLLLSMFPFALVALFIAGRVLRSEELQASVLEDLKRIFPTAAESTLSEGVRRLQKTSTTVGHRGRGRLDLVRLLVLGRAGHRVLPHLPLRVPHVGAAEAVRARHVRRRAAVRGRHGRGPDRAGAARLRARATSRSGSRRSAAWSTRSRSASA